MSASSAKLSLGMSLPPFELPSVDGKQFTLESFKGKKLLILMFLSNRCPYVKALEDRLIDLNRYYAAEDVQFVGICSNDPAKIAEDSPQNLLKRWKEKKYGFPYLIDDNKMMANTLGATFTPDFYIFDAKRCLVYHGGMDEGSQEIQDKSKLRSMVRDYLSMRVRIRAEAVSGHRVGDTGVMHHGMRA